MGKVQVDAAIFGGSSVKKVPLRHKIDMFGSYVLLVLVWIVILINTELSISQYIAHIPNEMLLHGPVIINYSLPNTEKRMVCNPLYEKFIKDDSLLTDDFKGDVLTKARSDDFLALPEVAEALKNFNNTSNMTAIGILPSQVCELIPPNLMPGAGCMKFSDIEKECLKGECGSGVNFCWWNQMGLYHYLLIGSIITFIPASVLVVMMMFDPPPIGVRFIAKPIFCAIFFFLTTFLGVGGLVIIGLGATKYLNQEALWKDYAGYSYSPSTGYWCVHIVTESCAIFGLVYAYIHFFTPSYPRHPPRLQIRRNFFNRQMKNLQTKYNVDETTA